MLWLVALLCFNSLDENLLSFVFVLSFLSNAPASFVGLRFNKLTLHLCFILFSLLWLIGLLSFTPPITTAYKKKLFALPLQIINLNHALFPRSLFTFVHSSYIYLSFYFMFYQRPRPVLNVIFP